MICLVIPHTHSYTTLVHIVLKYCNIEFCLIKIQNFNNHNNIIHMHSFPRRYVHKCLNVGPSIVGHVSPGDA